MTSKIKLILLLTLLVFSMTACKAEAQKEVIVKDTVNDVQLSDSINTADYTPGEWITDYKKALALSAETEKPVLVNFTGSDWCIWCKRLNSEVFTQKEFMAYAKESLILLKLDFPKNIPQTPEEKKQNENLAKNFKIEGFPTIVILDKDGNETARTQYRQGGAESYVTHLQEIIKQPE